MLGLVPSIHVLPTAKPEGDGRENEARAKAWMLGTSPSMTRIGATAGDSMADYLSDSTVDGRALQRKCQSIDWLPGSIG
jgi:hypothetical protein